jgi:hypothetical protein
MMPNKAFHARRSSPCGLGPRRERRRYIFVRTLLIVVCLCALPVLSAAAERDVALLGQKDSIPFDEIKASYIARTVYALLQSCTVATEIKAIPAVSYKGVRITEPGGKVIEAHIFPNSKDSYLVEVYTRDQGKTLLHGKYSEHAYQLISMLEMKI